MTIEHDLLHLKMWGCTREGMSAMDAAAKAALIDDESLVLVTKGAVAANSMPPGFVRFLTDEEMLAKGMHFLVPSLTARVGRMWNSGHPAQRGKGAPYYRQFEKRRF